MLMTGTPKRKRMLNIFFEKIVVKYEIFYSQSLEKQIISDLNCPINSVSAGIN